MYSINEKTIIVGRYLLQTSIRNLQNDFIKNELYSEDAYKWNNQKLPVSNTMLRYQFPKKK